MTDPRNNAPARLSDLHGDARFAALMERHYAARDRHMAQYVDPAPKRSIFAELAAMLPYPFNAERTESFRRSTVAVLGLVVAGVMLVALALAVKP